MKRTEKSLTINCDKCGNYLNENYGRSEREINGVVLDLCENCDRELLLNAMSNGKSEHQEGGI